MAATHDTQPGGLHCHRLGGRIGLRVQSGLLPRARACCHQLQKSEREAREVAAICEAKGGQTIVVQADVSSDEDCRRLARAVETQWGRIDALVNNAGSH